jgi:hypothetical protein
VFLFHTGQHYVPILQVLTADKELDPLVPSCSGVVEMVSSTPGWNETPEFRAAFHHCDEFRFPDATAESMRTVSDNMRSLGTYGYATEGSDDMLHSLKERLNEKAGAGIDVDPSPPTPPHYKESRARKAVPPELRAAAARAIATKKRTRKLSDAPNNRQKRNKAAPTDRGIVRRTMWRLGCHLHIINSRAERHAPVTALPLHLAKAATVYNHVRETLDGELAVMLAIPQEERKLLDLPKEGDLADLKELSGELRRLKAKAEAMALRMHNWTNWRETRAMNRQLRVLQKLNQPHGAETFAKALDIYETDGADAYAIETEEEEEEKDDEKTETDEDKEDPSDQGGGGGDDDDDDDGKEEKHEASRSPSPSVSPPTPERRAVPAKAAVYTKAVAVKRAPAPAPAPEPEPEPAPEPRLMFRAEAVASDDGNTYTEEELEDLGDSIDDGVFEVGAPEWRIVPRDGTANDED